MENLTIEKQKLFDSIIFTEFKNYINDVIKNYDDIFFNKKDISITTYIRNIGFLLNDGNIKYSSEKLEIKVKQEYQEKMENIFEKIPNKEFLMKNSINRTLLRREISKILKKFIEKKNYDNYSTIFMILNRCEYFGVNLKHLSKEINGVIKEIIKNRNNKEIYEVLELVNKGIYIEEGFLTSINLNVFKMEELKKQNKFNEIELNYDKMAYSIKNKKSENIKKFKI